MAKALGMIETRGLATSIEALDVMVKTSFVQLVKQNMVDPALVTIVVEGDVSAVKAAVEAGVETARKKGSLIAFNVIPHPDGSLPQLFMEQPISRKQEAKIVSSLESQSE
ncbi:BMC domain-containing protein [Neobacillus rhizophilus]|uniref:BMC domain-containing protein n=1 Tax=Neobacillus rhizophilus TaxID=2833579 RepID=A0A942U1Y7_9BACI|nr:BMC domain-containing protein [Neobacillus rhizophilus]MBS4210956.1 BMC domain-containing protein [Neobacillus rhizophilus]